MGAEYSYPSSSAVQTKKPLDGKPSTDSLTSSTNSCANVTHRGISQRDVVATSYQYTSFICHLSLFF